MNKQNPSQNLASRLRVGSFLAVFLLGGLLPEGAPAQELTTLHDFSANSGYPNFANYDGGYPNGGLIKSGDTLYGTSENGGNWSAGTVFKVNINGTGFTTLHSFSAVSPNGYPSGTNSDGANPVGGLVLSGNTLYGTAEFGGGSGHGTLFKLNTDGTGFTPLHNFSGTPSAAVSSPITNSDGAFPYSALNLSGNVLYGTAESGGGGAAGTVFAVNTDGTGFTTLHSFAAFPYGNPRNSDGIGPGGLVLSSNTLYGTAAQGGTWGNGTEFAINTNGTGFTTLHHFAGYPSDGAEPQGALILVGDTLYGTATGGGISGSGTLFAVHTDGTGFTNLHNFTGTSGFPYYTATNGDGAGPYGGLVLSGNILCGTASGGGSLGDGTLFEVGTDGTGFTTLHDFAGSPNDGDYPMGGLVLSGETLYGTTEVGGNSREGTVFSYSFTPLVTTQRASCISATGAVLNGSVTVGTNEAVAWFEWGTDTNYGNIAGVTTVPGNTGSNNISAPLSGLPGNIYHYRLDAANDFGVVYGDDQSFTVGFAPTAITLPSTNGANGVVLEAAVNPEGWDTTVYFQWVTLTLTNTTPGIDIAAGAASLSVSSLVPGLTPATPFKYQVVASNALGTALGTIVYGGGDFVTTQPASGLSANGAVLNGSVTGGPDEAVAWFDWGTDTNYGNIAGATTVPGNSGINNISAALSGLPGNIYHYRMDAATGFGIVYGDDQSFTVGFAPSAKTLPPTNGANGATLQAAVNPEGWDTTVYFQWKTPTLTNTTPGVDIGAGAASVNVSSFVPALSPSTSYQYQVVASNALGTVFGNVAWDPNQHHYFFSGSKTNITLPPGTYVITAYGAPGSLPSLIYIAQFSGGNGAEMSAEFNFSTYTTLTLLVGGGGGVSIGMGYGGGGGGGSFVVEGSTPLVIAGGGGGTDGHDEGHNGNNGKVSANGGNGFNGGTGGTNGGGGGGGLALNGGGGGGGGGGFLGNGTNGSGNGGYGGGGGGSSFETGGKGGNGGFSLFEYAGGYGGYGGGGGGGGNYGAGGGGGGGGYSGGAGGHAGTGYSGRDDGGGSIIDSSAIAIVTEVSGILSPDDPNNGEIIIIAVPTPLFIPIHAAFGITNGVFGFNVIGPSGSNVVIQASTDLQTWIPLQTNLLGSAPLYFSDPQSTTSIQRFYRVRLSP